jgi:hypothetical protein
MQLTPSHQKVLEWIEAQQPVIGMFHVMTEIGPMIANGLVEQRSVLPSKRQLIITEAGRAALKRPPH